MTANAQASHRLRAHEARCQTCSLSSLCLPLAQNMEDIDQFDAIIRRRAPLRKGEVLFTQGDAFDCVFTVRSGSLKQITNENSGLNALSEQMPELRTQLFKSLSKELHEDRRMMMLLSRKTADERLASFLVNLSQRFRRRGYSPYSFRLSMARADIGNYLGLAVETISRILTRFQTQGLVDIRAREVHILHLDGLIELAEGECQGGR